MADFVHLVSLSTAPSGGWMGLFAVPSRYTQVELTADHWTVRGTPGSGMDGWTVTLYAATTFGPSAGGFPSGAIGGIDVRMPDGTLAATVRGLEGLNLPASTLQTNPFALLAGGDVFTGSNGQDLFAGGGGADTINGGAGDDILYAGGGFDVVNGGAGNDLVVLGGAQGTIDGGAGNDTVSGGPIFIILGPGGVALTNVETLIGHDVLVTSTSPASMAYVGSDVPANSATTLDDRFILGSAADTVTGGWGADTIDGGTGNDVLDGSNPSFTRSELTGGRLTYTTTFDTSRDLLSFATAPNGVRADLTVSTPQDTLAGVKTLLNFERLEGSNFGDTLAGVAFINGGLGNDRITGADGDGGDDLRGGEGADTIRGGAGGDSIFGENGDDILVGGAGSDQLQGGPGFDIVDYTAASLVGVRINLTATGGQDDGEGSQDTLTSIEGAIGSNFADTLSAAGLGQGAYLAGNAGSDLLVGSSFDDVLFGGAGADNLTGGTGADKFVLQTDGATDRVTDFDVTKDYLVALDNSGAVAANARSVLTFDARTHLLSWDADGDGGQAAVNLAVLDNVGQISSANLAAGFTPTLVRLVDSSGAHSDVRYAWSDPSFSKTAADYDVSGKLLTYSVDFRDGSHWTKWFDSSNAQSWDTLVAEYDTQGRLTGYGSFFDDTSHILRYFDVGNLQPWQRLVDEYDSSNRLVSRGVVLDDGNAWQATWDVANTQPWGYYIESWDPAGRYFGKSYFNDDGSVFA